MTKIDDIYVSITGYLSMRIIFIGEGKNPNYMFYLPVINDIPFYTHQQ